MIGSRSTIANWIVEDDALLAGTREALLPQKWRAEIDGGSGTSGVDDNFTDASASGADGYLSRFGMNATSGDMVCVAVLVCILLQVLPVVARTWESLWDPSWWGTSSGASSARKTHVRLHAVAREFKRKSCMGAFRFVWRGLAGCHSPQVLGRFAFTAYRMGVYSMLSFFGMHEKTCNELLVRGAGSSSLHGMKSAANENKLDDFTDLKGLQVPSHIAIIMDGNRRHGKEVYGDATRGHADGGHVLSKVIDWSLEAGIRIVTVYAFSTENWKRDPAEINLLMSIFEREAGEILKGAVERGVCVHVLSSQPERLPVSVQKKFEELQHETRHGRRLVLNLCVSYGGRDEIVGACRRVAKQVENGTMCADDISEAMLSNEMLTAGKAGIPGDISDPCVVIRTSGERRLSNFLLWQVAYSELIFIEKHWPAVEKQDFIGVVREFSRRKRRFGK